NVAFAAEVSGRTGTDAEELLGLVGLERKLDSLPSELSGGEQQRVAIARALSQGPELLLCDEPTGHLDSDTAGRVLDLFDRLHEDLGFALVVATHDRRVADRYDRRVELADGRVVGEEGA
ncbi:MAG: putative transport system ATP-binding protein, partial [Thermoleophilaceae bacterium]|nr:putative transport system ATP-binding protein [Thermoleophilaceae bacterium]